MTLDARSEKHLLGVHPDLVRVMRAASERTKFRITEGLRDQTRQAELVRSGKSKTQNSRHLTGHAVDIIAIGDDGIATYDMEDMARVAAVVRDVAKEQGVPIQWGAAAKYGGDFKTFNDSPHFQLPWKQYPAIGVSTTTRVVEAASKPPVAVTGGAAVGAGVATVPALPSIPAPPDLSGITAWQSAADTVSNSVNWVSTNVTASLLVVGYIVVTVYWTTVWPPVKAFLGKWRAA
jgi:peptidoglycan L-alanyl-D-glutamate endopeptidase CwlK